MPLYVQVFLRNGDNVRGNLVEYISAETQILISEESITLFENKEGLLIHTGPSRAIYIEQDLIHSFVPLN